MSAIDILGYIGATLSTFLTIPQVYTTWKTKDVSGLSPWFCGLFIAASVVWLSFGVLLKSAPIIIANGVCLLSTIALLTMWWRWRKPSPQPTPAPATT